MERVVQVFKQGMCKQSTGSIHDKIARLLLQYRITPHSTTGTTPAEMLLGRKLRSHLDLLKPNIGQKVIDKQQQQKNFHDAHCRERIFSEGESVCKEQFERQEMDTRLYHQTDFFFIGTININIRFDVQGNSRITAYTTAECQHNMYGIV